MHRPPLVQSEFSLSLPLPGSLDALLLLFLFVFAPASQTTTVSTIALNTQGYFKNSPRKRRLKRVSFLILR